MMPRLILASTSRYRQQLLERLRLPFATARPDVDECLRPGETAASLARRLAREKALAVAATAGHGWTLGSDQTVDLNGTVLGKPGTVEAAQAQLAAMAGQSVLFHTAICLASHDGQLLEACDTTRVCVRALSASEIARYIAAESPLDCAGSFKCEGLGISLFDAIHTQDPTALIGLPLISLSQLLRQAGFELP